MLGCFRQYLIESAAEAGLGPEEFRPIPDDRADAVASSVEAHFGDSVRLHWWGTDMPCGLPAASRHFPDDQGWAHISRLAPEALLIPTQALAETRRAEGRVS